MCNCSAVSTYFLSYYSEKIIIAIFYAAYIKEVAILHKCNISIIPFVCKISVFSIK